MAVKKVLVKELEVVAGLTGNPVGNQILIADSIFDAMIDNPTIATLTSSQTTIKAKIADIMLLESQKSGFLKTY